MEHQRAFTVDDEIRDVIRRSKGVRHYIKANVTPDAVEPADVAPAHGKRGQFDPDKLLSFFVDSSTRLTVNDLIALSGVKRGLIDRAVRTLFQAGKLRRSNEPDPANPSAYRRMVYALPSPDGDRQVP